jgi:hypothetical protein
MGTYSLVLVGESVEEDIEESEEDTGFFMEQPETPKTKRKVARNSLFSTCFIRFFLYVLLSSLLIVFSLYHKFGLFQHFAWRRSRKRYRNIDSLKNHF